MNYLDKLLSFQEFFSKASFTIGSDGNYYRDFTLKSGAVVRIVPQFEEDKLVSVDISNQKKLIIDASGNIPLNKLPGVSIRDMVIEMIAHMSPQSRIPLKESYIIEEICEECGKTNLASFLRLNGKTVCLDCQ